MVLRTALLAVVLLASGAAAPEPDISGPANRAFVDAQATQSVAAQVKEGLEAVLSYTWSNVDRWRAAVQKYTTGNAAKLLQNQLTATLPTITQQQAAVTTTVVDLGVRDQRGNQAELLAFVNTSTTRHGGQLAVTGSSVVVRVQDGKITDLQVPR